MALDWPKKRVVIFHRTRVVRSVTIDEQLDQIIRRVWTEAIKHGWRRPSYSLALNNTLYALFYTVLHHMTDIHGKSEPYMPDRNTALKVLDVITGKRAITREEYALFDKWVEALAREGYMTPTSNRMLRI